MFGKLRQKIREAKLKQQAAKDERKKAERATERKRELYLAMDKLVKEHPYIATIEEAYLRIVLYTHCENMQENELCKEYLRQKYYSGYGRYDDERL